MLNNIAIGIIPSTTFLLFLLFSETSFDIATGRDNVAIIMNNPYVGIINIYSPIPSIPIILVVIILIIILSIFVINPPIIRIIVPFINFSFILKIMLLYEKRVTVVTLKFFLLDLVYLLILCFLVLCFGFLWLVVLFYLLVF